MIYSLCQTPQCRWVLYVSSAIEHYYFIITIGLFVLPSIEGILTIVAAGGPLLLLTGLLLLLLCCVSYNGGGH